MKYGISVTERGGVAAPTAVADTAVLAEDHGFDFASFGDAPALLREAYTTLALVAARTEHIGVGPIVTNPVTRHPVVTASAICTLDQIAGSRAFLGIATGDSGVLSLGEHPATLETVETAIRNVQALSRGESVGLDDAPAGDSRVELNWVDRENPDGVPVWLAAEGPKTQELAGRVAEGVVLGGGLTPALLERQVDNVRRGARAANRDISDIDVWITARANVDDDPDRAVEDLKPGLASIANHSMRYTFADKAVPAEYHDRLRELQETYRPHEDPDSGDGTILDRLGLTDFLASRYAIVGEPADCAETMRAIRDVDGVDGVYLTTPMDRTRQVLTGFAEEVFPLV
jgi:5,10-methylenetetrahydromethanopterin reductase